MAKPRARALDAIRRAAPLFARVSKQTRLLDALSWPREVEERFFAKRGKELPEVAYEVDKERATENVRDLEGFAMTLDVADPIQRWLVDVARSYADGNRMILAIGTPRFHTISVDVYGGPRSPFDADTSNLDLAIHLERRLEGEHAKRRRRAKANPREEKLDAHAFADALVDRARSCGIPVRVVVDDRLTAKVVAGTTRVRVREGATFRPAEVEGLFTHEVETHALTAQNGAAQRELSFLRSGGPRTTRTQEGLAVFAELHAHALTAPRMRRIVRRVRLVAMAEEGADFLELHRWLLDQGAPERDAWFDAQRIFRGGVVSGRFPFTKDAAYLAGFTEVFNFLQVAVRGGAERAVHLLACGRIALDDLAILHELAELRVLEPPAMLPRWMRAWDALLPYFAFTSFLNEIDLRQVEARHRRLLDAARIDEEPR